MAHLKKNVKLNQIYVSLIRISKMKATSTYFLFSKFLPKLLLCCSSCCWWCLLLAGFNRT